jgi:hypothetical protein
LGKLLKSPELKMDLWRQDWKNCKIILNVEWGRTAIASEKN